MFLPMPEQPALHLHVTLKALPGRGRLLVLGHRPFHGCLLLLELLPLLFLAALESLLLGIGARSS